MAKQKLSPTALKKKRTRDLEAAKTPLRKKRKRENLKYYLNQMVDIDVKLC